MSCSARTPEGLPGLCEIPSSTTWFQSPWTAAILALGLATALLYHQARRTAAKPRRSDQTPVPSTEALPAKQDHLGTTDCCSTDPAATGCACRAGPVPCEGTDAPAANPTPTPDAIVATYYAQPLKVFFGTQTGTSKQFAEALVAQLGNRGLPAEPIDLAVYDTEDFLAEKSVCAFLIATYNVENPTDWFLKWLEDIRYDFRMAHDCLAHLRFAVFGLGDSAYGDEFGFAGRCTDKWLGALGARRMYPLGEGDKNADQLASFQAWADGLVASLLDGETYVAPVVADTRLSDAESEAEDETDIIGTNTDVLGASDHEMVDLEDMGRVAHKIQEARGQRAEDEASFAATQSKATATLRSRRERKAQRPHRALGDADTKDSVVVARPPREMVSPMIHQNLTKQGYKVIGSHSGVKICRWTKSALRGRGFCYKHSFYGIQSHLCMETTPSLACANKCVFCWRHHTNPVGTEWRWQMDDPAFILDGAMANHYQMIKQFKGVPGVKADRFQEAFQVQHCALSLVGEPIMYPRINDFVKLLHQKGISSFLVTNAQFPDKIAELDPVTQLYVSVDASTKDSLKKVDRPLFRDFWERFLGSLDSLRTKGQRTVYRLTLVKSFNTEELASYVELIQRGRPEFIEVKGVTYCGFSGASNLTMANVPYHNEVIHFVETLTGMLGGEYEVACEHAHSCSVLVAHKKFKVDGRWNTWIDYARFQELVATGEPFTSLDYMAPTPEWAVFGNEHHGFDPNETRFYRKKGGGAKAAAAVSN
ncbi:Fe-S oxidoreductase [Tieghemiomyces parasiticus]|uniref:S-adenosyl-L-methionine-dependent tRNA 4-demethylwyosine synthase n=1 Tax=Tieghemiomyces parasiticus TaxID=78921 RepID=A0A9W8DRV1_9FUNG|nr:Fe-S oxidoreductase [Tieghemiomyces parasiticus]